MYKVDMTSDALSPFIIHANRPLAENISKTNNHYLHN